MFGVPPAVVGLLKQMGAYLQSAIKRAAMDAATGTKPDPDAVAEWLQAQMADWQPTMKGRPLADPNTRRAAARFLAGVACNLVTPGAQHDRAV